MLNVLVACEYSGTVRDAFIKLGHKAISCDLLDTDVPGPHYKGSVFDIINDGWDMMIAHPPCTYIASSGSRWFYHPDDKYLNVKDRRPHPRYPNREKDREDAIDFFLKLYNSNIPMIAIENPIGVMSTVFRKPDQIIQPYQYGDTATKTTCLWLKNLPQLKPTNVVDRGERVYFDSGKSHPKWYADALKLDKQERMKARSKTFSGIANAIAKQYSEYAEIYFANSQS
jgi:hypothetical protein